NPLCWEADAWLGRCQHLAGDPNKARAKFAEILNENTKAAAAGKRLASYFRLLVLLEGQPAAGENPQQTVKKAATQWIRADTTYLDTPEGQGIRWLLARADVELADNLPKGTPPVAKTTYLNEAKAICRQLEQSENEYTVRARKLKIGIIKQEGGLAVPVDSLP